MFVYTSMYPSVCKIDGETITYSRVPGLDTYRVVFSEHEDFMKKNFSGCIQEVPGTAPSIKPKPNPCRKVKHLTVVK